MARGLTECPVPGCDLVGRLHVVEHVAEVLDLDPEQVESPFAAFAADPLDLPVPGERTVWNGASLGLMERNAAHGVEHRLVVASPVLPGEVHKKVGGVGRLRDWRWAGWRPADLRGMRKAMKSDILIDIGTGPVGEPALGSGSVPLHAKPSRSRRESY